VVSRAVLIPAAITAATIGLASPACSSPGHSKQAIEAAVIDTCQQSVKKDLKDPWAACRGG